MTADKGVIDYSGWVIPKNASMGIYALNVTSISIDATKKDPPDFQNFSIPGYSVNVTTKNLAKEPVSNVIVRVYENTTSIMNATSNSNGVVNLMLERGNYTCEADFKDVKVGELALSIVKEASFDLYCNLTNLHILVKDESDYLIPEAEVELAPENLVLNTNINGTAIAHSLLPNVTYTLNSSRYGEQFNTTTIEALIVNDKAVASYNVTVICPAVTLQVNLHDSEHQPIPNAAVRVQEFMGGLFYEGNVVDGSVTFSCTFGRYKVKVYRSGVEVNQTTVDLFENQSLLVICRRCGLTVHIKVVDYLGQPISNANVSLLREGLMPLSDRTNNDGSVTFDDFIGGLAQVSVYLTDQTQPCVRKTFLVESSTTIDIKIERYVLVLGFLVETSQLATVILVMAAIFIVLLIEVFRRRQIKS